MEALWKKSMYGLSGFLLLVTLNSCGGDSSLSDDNFTGEPTVIPQDNTNIPLGDPDLNGQDTGEDSLRMAQDSLPVLPGKDTLDFVD